MKLFSWIFIVLVCIAFARSQKLTRGQEDVYNQCVNIKEPICQGIQYTKTKLPNLAGIANQEDSGKRLHEYYPLINADCSQYFRFFLCTIYFPMCSEALGTASILLPCNSLCVHVQFHCEPYLREFQLPWPSELNCHKFPRDSTLCIKPKNYDLDQNKTRLDPVEINRFKKLYPNWNTVIQTSLDDNKPTKTRKYSGNIVKASEKCLPPFLPLPFHSSAPNQSQLNLCLLRCDANLLYTSTDKQLSRVWLLVWAILGLISSVVAIAAFMLDHHSRFRYPERPIVFIVICYGCVCVFHLAQLLLGKQQMICHSLQSDPREFVMIREGVEGPLCTLMFLGTYYFEMVAAVWWLMLAVSCFLASARKWSSEGLNGVSNVMHMASWMIPALKVTVILIIHKIDADELLGMCYVGRRNSTSNLVFVLIPRIVYFSIGALLLIISFKSLMSLRQNLTQPELKLFLDGLHNQQSLDKFIVKTGIFCGVYGIPMICYIGCQLYYYLNTDQWSNIAQISFQSDSRCLSKSGLRWSETSCLSNLSLPLIEVRLLESFSSLVIGITSAMWMWCNKKTFITFSDVVTNKLYCKCRTKRSTSIEIEMRQQQQQYCYKNVNTAFSLDSKSNQYSAEPCFTRNLGAANQEQPCYNPNLFLCSV